MLLKALAVSSYQLAKNGEAFGFNYQTSAEYDQSDDYQ